MPTFQIDYRIPGTLTASGRPMSGSLIGPFPDQQAAIAATEARHPGASITAATALP